MAITNISALWDLDSSTRVFDYLNSSGNEIIQVQNFIENQFLDPEHTPQWINSFAPRSGKVRAIVPRSPPNIVEYAVNVASQAFSTWSKSTVQRRSEILHRIASIMEQKIELFVVWESIDHGKPLFRARAEVERSIEHFRFVNCSLNFCI